MRDLTSNLKSAWRGLLRNPAFGVVAVLTLTLGVAANTVTFSLVNTLVLKPLPFKDPGRIVWIDSALPGEGRDQIGVAYPDFLDWKERNRSFTDMAACEDLRIYLSGDGQQPTRLTGAAVSSGLFSLLGVQPLRGRLFVDEESIPGRDAVALVSHGLWQDRFGGDPGLIGKTLRIDGNARTVVGIMPPNFKYPEYSDVWMPLAVEADEKSRESGRYSVTARLRDNVSIDHARREMLEIAGQLEAEHPETNAGRAVSVRTLRQRYVGETDIAALVFFGVSLFVLLIATANIANLLLARAAERQREIALRSALGANRFRLAGQLLTESLLLAFLGLLPGLLLGSLGLRLLLRTATVDFPFWAVFGLDFGVIAGVAVIALLAGAIFGVAPIRHAWRTQLSEALKTRTTTAGLGSRRLSRMLVAAETAVALSLLAGAGMMLKGYIGLHQSDPGFRPEGVLAASLVPFGPKYESPEQRRALQRRVTETISQLPSVRSVATGWSVPLQGASHIRFELSDSDSAGESRSKASTVFEVVSPEYFATLTIPVVQGRAFTIQDRQDSVPVAIVNEAFARRRWPGIEAVGQRLRLVEEDRPTPWLTVVGVVGNVRSDAFDPRPDPILYVPYEQRPTGSFVIFADAAGANLAATAPALRSTVWRIDPDLPIEGLMPLDQAVSRALWQPKLYSWLFGVFAFFALVLAGAGIYGVVAYSVSQRTQEIAVRMALGAGIADVLRAVLGQTIVTVSAGLLLGILGSFAIGEAVAALLPASDGINPTLLVAVSGVFLLVATLASFLPARRAVQVEPLTHLRGD